MRAPLREQVKNFTSFRTRVSLGRAPEVTHHRYTAQFRGLIGSGRLSDQRWSCPDSTWRRHRRPRAPTRASPSPASACGKTRGTRPLHPDTSAYTGVLDPRTPPTLPGGQVFREGKPGRVGGFRAPCGVAGGRDRGLGGRGPAPGVLQRPDAPPSSAPRMTTSFSVLCTTT